MARPVHTAARLLLAAFLVVAGIAMLVLPGPGVLTIALGIGVAGRALGWQWADRLERRVRSLIQRQVDHVGDSLGAMDPNPSLGL